MLCQLLTASQYKKYINGTEFNDLSPEGPLHLLGYSVSKESNLSDTERRQLLNWIIANNIMEKSKVLYYLRLFVKKSGSRSNMTQAIKKWRGDIQFLTGLNIRSEEAPPMGVARFVEKL